MNTTTTTPTPRTPAQRLRDLADALDELSRLVREPARANRLAPHVVPMVQERAVEAVAAAEQSIEVVLHILRQDR